MTVMLRLVSSVQNLVGLLSEEDEEVLRACWGALGAVTSSIAKELLAGYSRCLRDALATAREKQRRKRKPGELLIPGLCLLKTLGPILPIYLQVRIALDIHRLSSAMMQFAASISAAAIA